SSGFLMKPGSETAVTPQKSNVIEPQTILNTTISEYFHSAKRHVINTAKIKSKNIKNKSGIFKDFPVFFKLGLSIRHPQDYLSYKFEINSLFKASL
ncbi:MAG: hypothetical protein ACK55Z_25565, partial [bacterium]